MIALEINSDSIATAEVAERIHIGRMPCGYEVKQLKEKGITAVLSIMRPEEGSESIRRAAEERGMEWSSVPITDSYYDGIPTTEQILEAVEILDRWVRKGHEVYIHCLMAQGRSPLIAVAYRCLIKGERLMAAIQAVKEAWPDADSNSKQIEVLCGLLHNR